MSAWCLGMLNSHRKFFLSYVAPVVWNAAIIGALVYFGRQHAEQACASRRMGRGRGKRASVRRAAPGRVSAPGTFQFELSNRLESVHTSSLRNFVPVLVARGVVQVSAYIDNVLASYLPRGAVSALAYAQSIYMLPISLFGMSISAAELPAMSSAQGIDRGNRRVSDGRLNAGFAARVFHRALDVRLFDSGRRDRLGSLSEAASSVMAIRSTSGPCSRARRSVFLPRHLDACIRRRSIL